MIALLFNVVGACCKRKDMIADKHRDEVKQTIGSKWISTGLCLNEDQTLERANNTSWGSHYRTSHI